ncbi:MAG: hypothetical protein ACW98F_00880 [Candidatus Hodarchaeales archaeon]|jgi:hypothetical protein
MIRTSIRPYEEITILSLPNIATETKFQCFCKIAAKEDAYVILSDDNSEYKFPFNANDFVDTKIGDIVLAFGQKEESGMNLEKLIKLNLDWPLFVKIKAIEQI